MLLKTRLPNTLLHRYYYAVVTFDSPETAKAIYDATDGTEYLASANFFDLRFIPDAVSFDEDVSRDEATDVPDNYRPNEFVTDALQHSKVKLTWDADDGVRKEVVRKAFGRREAEEQDLKAYLGSDSSDEDDTRQSTAIGEVGSSAASKKEAERKRLRMLLGLDEADSGSKKKGDPVGDMQITFSSGLAGDAKDRVPVFNEPEETTIEKYVRKERERKQRRKDKIRRTKGEIPKPTDGHLGSNKIEKKIREHGSDEPADPPSDDGDKDKSDHDLGFDDPFFTADPSASATAKTSRQRKESRRLRREQRVRDAKAEATKRAELELLMLDDDHVADTSGKKLQHFDINDVLKAEKAKIKKGKKGKRAIPAGAAVQEDFKMDVDDPRFSRLWEEHEFAIDPTNPRFRKTEGMKMLLEETRKKRRRDDAGGGGERVGNKKVKGSSVEKDEDSDELKSLVERVKRKHKSVKEGG
jgi:NUC153 domain